MNAPINATTTGLQCNQNRLYRFRPRTQPSIVLANSFDAFSPRGRSFKSFVELGISRKLFGLQLLQTEHLAFFQGGVCFGSSTAFLGDCKDSYQLSLSLGSSDEECCLGRYFWKICVYRGIDSIMFCNRQ